MRNSIYLVVIPVVVGLLGLAPWMFGILNPDRQLQFTLTGLVDVSPLTALRLDVENHGKYPEKNVHIILDSKVWIPPSERAIEDQITVQTKIPFTAKRDGDRLLVLLGDLRPKESVSVGIASPHISVSAYDAVRAPLGIAVKSDESVAEYESRAGFLTKYSFGIGSFLSLCLMLFGIVGITRMFAQLHKAKAPMPNDFVKNSSQRDEISDK
ncbi:hypothetical protein ACFZAI_20820 [Achromobacter sp. NPDC008082]|uniref:hypothetical protein n=1 Tax=Achromobacter sp. NPDC008082 TaxID=3363888 RepID=UPI0036E36369